MSCSKEIREARLVEGGRGGEFDFILEKCPYRSKSKKPYGRLMRFYGFHEDYIGYVDIRYIAFRIYKYHIAVWLPGAASSAKTLYISKSDLKERNIVYMTSYSPIY